MAKIISFVNQKGGTGKTTICINLGVGLVHLKKKVLIIDMDFQSNASSGLGYDIDKPHSSSFSLISDENMSIRDVIQDTYLKGLKLIPASFELKHINLLAEVHPEKSMRLKKRIEEIYNDFDFILIDNPPSISGIIYNSLFASDYVYIPVEMSYFGLEGLEQIENAMDLICQITTESFSEIEKAVGSHTISYTPKVIQIGGVIINKWNPLTKISNEIYNILRDRYHDKLFNTKVRNNTTIKEAIGDGIGIIDYDKRSHGAEDFINLTKEVADRESKR